MKFSEFAEFLQKIESISSRNQMTELMAAFLPKLKGEEIRQAMYLMQGRLVPTYVNLEFQMSSKLALRALDDYLLSESPQRIKAQEIFSRTGDVGLVAEQMRAAHFSKVKDSDISEVYARLEEMARMEGKGSQDAKVEALGKLLQDLDALSCRYVVRVVIGSLRLGLSDKTVLDALSWVLTGDKSLRDDLDRAFGAHADIGELAMLVMTTDQGNILQELDKIRIEPGVPVASKLVEREKSPQATFKRMGESFVQPKLDGLRAQIHLTSRGETSIFSRNMESLTDMFPELLRAVKELGVASIILDSEAIGYDSVNEVFLPFQQTTQRRRKHGIDEAMESIPIRAMAFDVLYLNGEDISRQPVEERLEKLQRILQSSSQKDIQLLETVRVSTEEEMGEYFFEQVGKGLEGVIVKKLGTTYDPGSRNFDWTKLKANTQSDLVDTVDVVVIGYFRGQGQRAKFGVGALLVGVPDSDGVFYSVAKVGTGMKDEDWKIIKSDLEALQTDFQPQNVVVDKILYPDVWVQPQIVMEIDADEITRSPSHTAGRETPASFEKDTKGRGLSLRFPRMKVWKRDKTAEQATSVQELVRMYELRKGNV